MGTRRVGAAEGSAEREPGDVIGDRFVIERRAGAGGMGTVYRARDGDGSPVAIKVLNAGGADNIARLFREARVLSALDHPGVVRYVAHGHTTDGTAYLAMEWLDGEDLASRLQRGPLGVDAGVVVARRAADALGTAHRRGVVHRDVKPSNLFLVDGDPERVKVLDFGIARLDGATVAMTSSGVIIGTVAYMAPEQARGDRDVDARADVFSLGCVLFECLTGRRVFEGAHAMAVLAKILMQDAGRLRDLLAGAPAPLDELLSRMLSKRASDRPGDGAIVAAALAALAEGSAAPLPAPATPAPGLTAGEQQLLSVILAGAGGGEGDEAPSETRTTEEARGPWDRLRALVAPYAPRIERMRDGSLIVALAGRGAATDQAAQAARCALAMRAALPGAPLCVVTGRGVLEGRLPVGDAIDRGVALLRGARGGQVLLDKITAGLLDERFDVAAAGGAHALRDEHPGDPEAPRTFMGKVTPCVGRDRELAALDAILAESIQDSVARAVVVTGPPGIGKSRLRYELLRAVRRRDEPPEVWIARCDPMGAEAPFGVVAKLLRGAAGLLDGEPLPVRRDKLLARVAEVVDARDVPRVAQFLGELVGTPFPDEHGPGLRAARADPRLMADEVHRAWVDFVAARCAARPTLLVVEDLHWSDATSASAAFALVRDLRDSPLMVLALARPEVRERFPALWVDRRVQEIALGELSRRASERLVRAVLGDDLDAAVVDRLVTVAAGNAFYLEELTRAAAEGGGAEPPETVMAMVLARLETLDLEDRRVLRAASVLGEVFWPGAVAALLGPAGPGEVRDRLDALAAREIVGRRARSRFADEVEYVFRHATVREAAHATLVDRDRVLGHQLAAEWLERAGGGDPLVLAESAQHAERAAEDLRRLGDADGAAIWFARVAVLRAGARRFDLAVTAMLRALELVDLHRHDAAQIVTWLEALTTSVDALRSAPRLGDLVDRLLPRIDAAGAVEERVRARVALARALGAVNVFGSAHALLDEAAAADRPRVRREVFLADMEISGRQGDFARALRAVKALEDLGAPEDPRPLFAMASLRAAGGEIRAAFEIFARAEALSDPHDPVAAVARQKHLGLLHLNAGDFAAAARASAAAAEAAGSLGLRYELSLNLHNLGEAQHRLGELAAARAALARSLEVAEALGSERIVEIDRAHLAYVDGLDGSAEARPDLERFIARAEESGYLTDRLEGERLLADLLRRRGDRAEARSRFERLVVLARRFGYSAIEREAVAALRDL